MRDPGADLALARVIDRDAIERQSGAEGEMRDVGARRRDALAESRRDGVAVEPRVAKLDAQSGDHPPVIEELLRIVALDRELRGEAEVQRPDGAPARETECGA